VKQAKLMDDLVDVVKVIYLVCGDLSKMVERLKRRALKENRIDDASDAVIRKRMEVYERETRPVLEYYPADKVVQIDATMSQIEVLSRMIELLVPVKKQVDVRR